LGKKPPQKFEPIKQALHFALSPLLKVEHDGEDGKIPLMQRARFNLPEGEQ
jgi:hypothetical protein